MTVTKSKSLSAVNALNLVYDFFELFQECFNEGNVPSESELGKYLAKNFVLTSNGIKKCRSITDYIRRFKIFQEEYTKFEISEPLQEPIISGNQLALHYSINLTTHEGAKLEIYIIALGKFENGKLASWTQVAHEKGSNVWDE